MTGTFIFYFLLLFIFMSTADIISGIYEGTHYFTKLDMVLGFYQILLDEESSYLTTFLIPQGRFWWLRCLMGSCVSSDEWCQRSDEAIRGLVGVNKLVDNILITSKTKEELFQRLMKVLERCRKARITLSKKKFEIGESISFVGYSLSSRGIQPDKRKLDVISSFPIPKDISKLRSFLGLANQLASFVPNLAAVTNPLHTLLKKDTAYTWLGEHTMSFNEMKRILTDALELHHFDPTMPTYLVTDASRLNGLGFALIQLRDGPTRPERLIQCGSRCLSSCEGNCDFFPRGMPNFLIVTDHWPLVGIFQRPLCDIANPCICRICEKMMPYNFDVKWLAGKSNAIADVLLQNLVSAEEPLRIQTYIVAASRLAEEMKSEAVSCTSYHSIVEAWRRGTEAKNLPPDHPGLQLRDIWTNLLLLDGSLLAMDNQRIFVPKACRQQIITLLHEGHNRITKTYAAAHQ